MTLQAEQVELVGKPLTPVRCWCDVPFALAPELLENARANEKFIFCPVGHANEVPK